jgi:hypothetical protein
MNMTERLRRPSALLQREPVYARHAGVGNRGGAVAEIRGAQKFFGRRKGVHDVAVEAQELARRYAHRLVIVYDRKYGLVFQGVSFANTIRAEDTDR